MATQPDFQRLASGFTAVAEEIRKLPEVPVINEGRAILESINGLRQHMDQQFDRLRADVGALRVDINTANTRLEDLETRMHADSFNQTARLYNSHLTSRNGVFRGLRDGRNRVIEGFPPRSAGLARLTGANLAALLVACGIEPDPTSIEAKRKQFRQFIGIVIDLA